MSLCLLGFHGNYLCFVAHNAGGIIKAPSRKEESSSNEYGSEDSEESEYEKTVPKVKYVLFAKFLRRYCKIINEIDLFPSSYSDFDYLFFLEINKKYYI